MTSLRDWALGAMTPMSEPARLEVGSPEAKPVHFSDAQHQHSGCLSPDAGSPGSTEGGREGGGPCPSVHQGFPVEAVGVSGHPGTLRGKPGLFAMSGQPDATVKWRRAHRQEERRTRGALAKGGLLAQGPRVPTRRNPEPPGRGQPRPGPAAREAALALRLSPGHINQPHLWHCLPVPKHAYLLSPTRTGWWRPCRCCCR